MLDPFSGKQEHSSGTGSEDSDPELSQAHKKGKEIQAGLFNLQCHQNESEALAVGIAAKVPLPDDDMTLDSDTGKNNSLDTDSALTQSPFSKPTNTCRGTKSLPSSLFDPFVRKCTNPSPVPGTGRCSS